MTLSFGTTFGYADIDHIGRLEEWGYDTVWTGEHILFYGPTLDALTQLAYFAGRTTRLRLGTAIYLLPLRNPTITAKAVSTLDVISGGRVTLGVGVGGEYPKEFEATGVPVNQRGSRTDESIRVLRRLWTESNVTHQGRHFQFTDVTMEPKPVQKPCPPIVVAGRSEAAQVRAGRLGDGYMPYLFDLRRYSEGAERVKMAAREAGRDLEVEPFRWCVFLFTALEPTKEEARALAAERLQQTYQQPFEHLVDRYCALGNADDCAERMTEFVRLGVNEFILVPLSRQREANIEKLEALATDVIPKVRKAIG